MSYRHLPEHWNEHGKRRLDRSLPKQFLIGYTGCQSKDEAATKRTQNGPYTPTLVTIGVLHLLAHLLLVWPAANQTTSLTERFDIKKKICYKYISNKVVMLDQDNYYLLQTIVNLHTVGGSAVGQNRLECFE